MRLLSYFRSIGRGKKAEGTCPTPAAAAAEAAAGMADENEDFFVKFKTFCTVKKRNLKIDNDLGIDLSLFE